MLVLDTCVLVFDALEPERLTREGRTLIADAERAGDLACCDISLWEIAMLVAHGRLDPGMPVRDFLRCLTTARRLDVLPVTVEIAARSVELPLDGDPADRLVAATTVVHRGRLLTSDRRLRESPAVPTVW